MRKKFTICGNCQAQPIGQLLNNNEEFSQNFELLTFPKPVFLLKKDDLKTVKECLAEVDLFIYQHTGDVFGKHFSSDAMVSYARPNSQCISFPSLYFTGYTPDIVYLRECEPLASEYTDYHDANLINYFLQDAASAKANYIASLSDPDFYSEAEIIQNAHNSLAELQQREQQLSIHISDFISDEWQNELLFFSMNHPSRRVLVEIAKRILKSLNIEDTSILGKYEHLDGTIPPVSMSVRRFLKNTPNIVIKNKGDQQTIDEYVDAQLGIYLKVGPDKLRRNLINLKKYKSYPKCVKI